jgi:chorismate dehydratase
MTLVKISAVSFANTYPFIYGLLHNEIINDIKLTYDVPSECADKLLNNKADIGLIPIAIIPLLKTAKIISPYCIGTENRIRTVQLMANNSIEDISLVYLDYQSHTSNLLVQILFKEWWNKKITFIKTGKNDVVELGNGEAKVVIGDKAFIEEKKFFYNYDLAYEWKKFTGLPFVFACWVSNKSIKEQFENKFTIALKEGIDNINKMLSENFNNVTKFDNIQSYYTENLSYDLNQDKLKGLNLFIDFITKQHNELII